jgi:hypothetical protein
MHHCATAATLALLPLRRCPCPAALLPLPPPLLPLQLHNCAAGRCTAAPLHIICLAPVQRCIVATVPLLLPSCYCTTATAAAKAAAPLPQSHCAADSYIAAPLRCCCLPLRSLLLCCCRCLPDTAPLLPPPAPLLPPPAPLPQRHCHFPLHHCQAAAELLLQSHCHRHCVVAAQLPPLLRRCCHRCANAAAAAAPVLLPQQKFTHNSH